MDFSAREWLWGIFALSAVGALALDLGFAHRRPHEVRMKEAVGWSAAWVGLAVAFGLAIWKMEGRRQAAQYFSAYLAEKTLSADNLFTFWILLKYFRIPPEFQGRVLHWGIGGAIVMRAIFIFAGIAILEKFAWTAVLLGGILIALGAKLFSPQKATSSPELPRGVRFFQKIFKTPFLSCLAAIELMDLEFALDSVPAALAITRDPLLVYSSNIFAVLGLRALYFVLAAAIAKMKYLEKAVAAILIFVGIKLALGYFEFHISAEISLAVIAGMLGAALAASFFSGGRAR